MINLLNSNFQKKFDIFIPIYFNDSDKSSYVKIKNSYINNIVEKKNISYNASSGIYGFKNLSILKFILKKHLKKNHTLTMNILLDQVLIT